MIVDTHAHIYLEAFDGDRDLVIQRALKADVGLILMPNIDHQSIQALHSTESSYPEICRGMMGLHPCSVTENVEAQLQHISEALSKRQYIAIGEIGMDLYWDQKYIEQQKLALRRQSEWALDREVPIVIHSRSALDDILDILEGMALPNLTGVFHCFGGSHRQAERIIELGFLIGIGGIVTFKNSNLPEVLPEIGLQHIVLETDSPYLAPTPFRGKRNEPAYLQYVVQRLANIYNLTPIEIAQETTDNALNLFQIKHNQS
ncbi:MAG: TatD family hydrolase [Saprospiraceae bacterium]|nr:TatD family hydrolase [Saprospiraceae bacterium]